ncbi:MAG: Hsp33 family molecular chaperone HslO [Pseudomonadales bacterium]
MSSDVIHRFSFANAPIRGQWVRLSDTLTEAFRRQPNSEPGRRLLGEMLAAVTLMADGIKFHGAVALQSRGNGPVSTALAECRHRNLLRGIVRWNSAAEPPEGAELPTDAGPLGNEPALSSLLGEGQMAITLIPDAERSPDAASYQGVVALTGDSLARNLEEYFTNSEQLPTRLFMAFEADQVTGLLLQRLPVSDEAAELTLDVRDDLWREVELLAETVTRQELAQLPIDQLLRRLFHQHTVTVHPGRTLEFSCTCSRERAERMLQVLPKDEILELLESQGMVDVTCEVCGARYEYDQVDTHLIYEPEGRRLH